MLIKITMSQKGILYVSSLTTFSTTGELLFRVVKAVNNVLVRMIAICELVAK